MRVRVDLDETLYEELVRLAERDFRPLDLEVLFLLKRAVEQFQQWERAEVQQ